MLRAAISIGVVAYILIAIDRGELWKALSSVRPGALLLPFGLYLAGQVLSAVKWWMLGTAVGLHSPLSDYVRFYFIGMFLNVFGLSTLGGDVVRGLYLGGGNRPALALNSVLFDRVSGLAILMAMGAVALLAFPSFHLPWGLSAALIAGGLGLVIAWWTCPLLVRLLPPGNRVRRQVEDDLAPFSDRSPHARAVEPGVRGLPSVAGGRAVAAGARGGRAGALLVPSRDAPRPERHDGAAAQSGRVRCPGGRLSLVPPPDRDRRSRSPSPSDFSGG